MGEGWVLEKEFGRSGRVGELLPVVEEEEGKVKEDRRGGGLGTFYCKSF